VKKHIIYNWLLLLIVPIALFTSCKKKDKDPYAEVKGNYFSIRQYAEDQWNTYVGEHFAIVKTVRVNNGVTDSSYTLSDTLDWSPIFKTFFATDISDRKFLGQYKFTQFDDEADDTHNFFYEALDDDLYTRKLLITIDKYNSKVRGIYVEAGTKSLLEDKTLKLYYKPMSIIQIQTEEKAVFGDKKHTVEQYDFMR
jgi:hypothetical protein